MTAPKNYYLQQARKARALAESTNPVFRDDFLRVAEQWEMLAEQLPDPGFQPDDDVTPRA